MFVLKKISHCLTDCHIFSFLSSIFLLLKQTIFLRCFYIYFYFFILFLFSFSTKICFSFFIRFFFCLTPAVSWILQPRRKTGLCRLQRCTEATIHDKTQKQRIFFSSVYASSYSRRNEIIVFRFFLIKFINVNYEIFFYYLDYIPSF